MGSKLKEHCNHDFESNPESAYCAHGCGMYEPDYIIKTLKSALEAANAEINTLKKHNYDIDCPHCLKSMWFKIDNKIPKNAFVVKSEELSKYEKLEAENKKLTKQYQSAYAALEDQTKLINELQNSLREADTEITHYKKHLQLFEESIRHSFKEREDDLKSENKKLREALEKIESGTIMYEDDLVGCMGEDDARWIAREALEKLK